MKKPHRKYRNKKLKHIDGFVVARVDKRESRLPYDIFLDSLGASKKHAGDPRVGVIVDWLVIPVLISEDPVTLSGRPFPGEHLVHEWVRKHYEPLLMHWNKRLTDTEVLMAVSEP
ncbi:hypothetical protein SAMN02910292_02571 [Lachnospiraceae bacterium XBB2008]|nr:hypothetical protein SAMN02910292_02571 [Lachnospiraceae bacterium XBB2008]